MDMGAETYRGNADDIRDAFAGFINMGFSTGMMFNFVATGKIGVIYGRMLIPGVTDQKTAVTPRLMAQFIPRRRNSVSTRTVDPTGEDN